MGDQPVDAGTLGSLPICRRSRNRSLLNPARQCRFGAGRHGRNENNRYEFEKSERMPAIRDIYYHRHPGKRQNAGNRRDDHVHACP